MAAPASCGQALDKSFTENWGLPQGEDRFTLDLQPVASRCETADADTAGTHLTFKGWQDYALGRDKDAAAAWESAAEAGNLLAMVALGDQEMSRGLQEGFTEAGLEQAYLWYRKAAKSGLPLGMSKLAWFYDEGHYVDADPDLALSWYKKAAEAGEPTAMRSIGDHFREGRSVPVDIVVAIRWYVWAGEAGDDMAHYTLGVIYDEGLEVPEDNGRAVYYFRIAALAGVPEAMHDLGWMYKRGEGVEQDFTEAAYWFQRAVDDGLDDAGGSLGAMYYEGLGVEQNTALALDFFIVAAVSGRPDAMADVSLICMEVGDHQTAYFWAVLAVLNGVVEVTFRLVELQALLPEPVLRETETLAANWTPGSAPPQHQTIKH